MFKGVPRWEPMVRARPVDLRKPSDDMSLVNYWMIFAPPPRWAGGGPLDVYVMWSITDRAAFLSPDGTWSPTPVPLRRAMDSGSPMTIMQWNPEPPGELPLAMVAVPSGASGATGWEPVTSHPEPFDVDEAFRSAGAVADAYGEVLHQSYAGAPDPPNLELGTVSATAEREVLIITETHAQGDDSVAGSQYALVVISGTDGWHLTSVWLRTVCRRGVDTTSGLCL